MRQSFKLTGLERATFKPVLGDSSTYLRCNCGKNVASAAPLCSRGAFLAPCCSHNLLEAHNAQAFSAPLEAPLKCLPLRMGANVNDCVVPFHVPGKC